MTEDQPPPQASPRRRLLPDGIELVQLYWSPAVLAHDVSRCRQIGWRVVELDVSGWHNAEQLHDDVVAALDLPEYYGRNLDALLDVLRGIADGSSGPANDPGLAIVLNNVDDLAGTDGQRLGAVLEIFTEAASHGLHHCWPLAVLVQSNDAELKLGPVGATSIPWNRAERQRSTRG